MGGWTGKLLRVDLAAGRATVEPLNMTWARDFMNEFEARGRVIRDGSDLPRLGRAQKIDKLAQAFGIEPF